MLARAKQLETLGISKQDAFETMLQCYGWGIPNEERLFRSAGDALTLIAEDKLQPYKLQDNRISLREMKYFKLPWPTDILKSLRSEEHTSELQSLMRISYAVFCLKKKK